MARSVALLVGAAASAALCGAAPAARPNVIYILADDLGWHDINGLSPGGNGVLTPNIDKLLAGGGGRSGARLSDYYGQPVCTPSRTSIMTGRYPLAYGLQTYVIDPPGVNYGLNLNETTVQQLLGERGGYATAHIGKAHIGMAAWNQTSTFRGFDYFYGYYSGGQDYLTHQEQGGFDLHEDATPRCGAGCSRVAWEGQGVYSAELYASRAQAWLAQHAAKAPAQPFYLYLAFQSVHAPAEVPPQYVAPYANRSDWTAERKTFAGMLTALDQGVGNVTAALAQLGLLDNTLIIFSADNGGPVFGGDSIGSTNWPLRGGKHSLWEGGVRLASIVNAPAGWLAAPSGSNITGLMHHVDWLPTLLEAANVSYTPAPGFELHGSSKWGMLTRGQPSDRNEVLLNIDPCQPAAVDPGVQPGAGNAAIRIGDMKLQVGLTGPPWDWPGPDSAERDGDADDGMFGLHPDGTTRSLARGTTCGAWGQLWPLKNMTTQLFNLTADPWERDDLAASQPAIVKQLLSRLAYWGSQVQVAPYWPTATVDPRSNPNNRNGTWQPWL